tara:strand:+ start:258 stop:728 length:471 start_codon:yes stop_codon:yes gene_type:complete
MAYYTFNDQNPVPKLPRRVRKEDGTTVTDLESLDSAALGELGWKAVPDIPDPSSLTWDQIIVWSDGEWKITELDDKAKEIKKGQKWTDFRKQRNEMIKLHSDNIEKYQSEIRRGVTPTVEIAKIDDYIEKLRQIPQTQTDPFNIVWPEYDDGGKGE